MTVLCVNSTVVYADIAAADAAEGGTNYGVPTRFEQTGTSSSSVFFVDVDYPSSLIYIATAGEETTGDIAVGAQMTATITTSVDNGVFQSLRTSMLNTSSAVDHHNQDIIASGSGLDVFTYGSNAGTDDNCIAHDCSEGWRGGSTNNNHIATNCTTIDCSGFGFLRPRAVDTVALNTSSATYLQEGASSSNYWADDGNGSDAITEGAPTDIFEDYAGGDYRIKAGSSPGVAGAGAFISTGGGGISITADSGTYTLNGTATPLAVSFNTAVLSGSYSLTGTATGLSVGYTLLAQSGTYTLTGTNTNVLAAYSAIAETGTYDLTGTNVTLIYTPVSGSTLVIDSGVFTLTGTSQELRVDRKTSLDSGNYSIVGTTTPIKYNGNVPLDSGIFSYTGTNINLITDYGIIAATAGYVLTGSSVTLKYSGDVTQVIGIVTSSFAPNTITSDYAPDTITSEYKPNSITVNFKG